MRPPGPLPVMAAGSRPCSATRRRTTGESNRESLAGAAAGAASTTGAGAGAGAGAGSGAASTTGAGAGAGSGSGAGAASTTGVGAGAGSGAGATTASAVPTTAMTAPTGTVSPSWAKICTTVPAMGDGTSVSTLSVLTSNNGSSAATVSPTFLNQRVMVPSVTVSPSCGSVTSAMVVSSSTSIV